MSRRTWRMRAVFVSWRVANWKRRRKSSSLNSRTRVAGSAAASVAFLRRSVPLRGCAFLSATLEALLDHELGCDRQLVRRQTERLHRQLLAYAADLEENVARLDHSHVVVRRALARAHAGFGRFGRD